MLRVVWRWFKAIVITLVILTVLPYLLGIISFLIGASIFIIVYAILKANDSINDEAPDN